MHNTERDAPDFTLHMNADGTWQTATISAALLADIRRELRAHNQREVGQDLVLREIRQLLRQLNKRLRDHGLKIKARP